MPSGMFVPQMVPSVDISGGLAQLGNTIGGLREDAAIANIMKGIDPYDPNSGKRAIQDLRAYGSLTARDMADRMQGLMLQRDQQLYARKYGPTETEYARGKEAGQEENTDALGRVISGGGPITGPGARTTPAPASAAPTTPTVAPTTPAPVGPRAPAPVAPAQPGGIFARPRPATPEEEKDLYEPTTAAAKTAADTTNAAAAAAGAPISTAAGTPLPPPPARPAATRAAGGLLATGAGGAAPGGYNVPAAPAGAPGAVGTTGATVAPTVAAARPVATAPPIQPPGPGRETPEHPSTSDPFVERRPPSYPAMAPFLSKKAQAVGTPEDTPEVKKLLADRDALQMWRTKVGADGVNMIDKKTAAIDKDVETRRAYQAKFLESELATSKESQKEDMSNARKLNSKLIQQRMEDQTALVSLKDAHEELSRGLQTGSLNSLRQWSGEMLNEGRTLARAIGIPESKLEWMKPGLEMAAGLEKFAALSAKGLFDSLGGFGKANSNEDRKVMEQTQAALPKTIEGNKKLVEFHMMVRLARMESIAAVQVYMKHRTENMQTLGPPTEHDISEIQHRYHQDVINRIGTLAGIDAAGARNMSEREHATAIKEARAKAVVQEQEAEAFRKRWTGGVGEATTGGAGTIGRTVRGAYDVGRDIGARAGEALKGAFGAGQAAAPKVGEFFRPGPAGGLGGAGGAGGLGGIPPNTPQRFSGEAGAGLDYERDFGPESSRGIVEQNMRLAPNGIPWESMSRPATWEDRRGETPAQTLERAPYTQSPQAFEAWIRQNDQRIYDERQTPNPYPEIARQAGLADLEASYPAMVQRSTARQRLGQEAQARAMREAQARARERMQSEARR